MVLLGHAQLRNEVKKLSCVLVIKKIKFVVIYIYKLGSLKIRYVNIDTTWLNDKWYKYNIIK